MVANMSGCSLESTEKIASCMKNIDIAAVITKFEVSYFTKKDTV